LERGADVDKQAAASVAVPNSPVAAAAFTRGIITPERAAVLPGAPENVKLQVWMNGEWWAKNGANVQNRWLEFLQ
jgi:putative spermidine/putrescine transport system substrate-binding protein